MLTTPSHFMHEMAALWGCISKHNSVSPLPKNGSGRETLSTQPIAVVREGDLEANKNGDVVGFDEGHLATPKSADKKVVCELEVVDGEVSVPTKFVVFVCAQ